MANTKVKAEQLEAAQTSITSVGTLTALQVDNLNLNGNTISTTDTNGNLVITPNGTGNVNVNTDVLAIQGTEGETASLALQCDESDDAGDEWRFTTNANQTLSIQNNISGSGVDHITITPHATVSSSTVYVPGRVGIGTNSPDVNSFGAGHGILTVQSATGSAKTAMLNLSGDGNDTDATRVASLFFNDASATGAGKSLAGVEAYRASNHATDPGGNLLFSTNASGGSYTERMRIRASGGVGIGTAGYDSQILAVNAGTGDTVLYGESTDANCFASFRDNSSTANISYGAIGNNHVFRADQNERMRITASGNVDIADGNLIFASGHGIDFSATGSGTSTSGQSHVLDEYEFGSWTPTCHTGSATFVSPYYVKIGRVVHFSFQVHQFTDTSTASSIDIRGLPFPCLVGQAAGTVFGIYLDHEVDSVYVNTAEEIFFYELTNSGWYAARHSDINSSSAYFYVGGTYITSS